MSVAAPRFGARRVLVAFLFAFALLACALPAAAQGRRSPPRAPAPHIDVYTMGLGDMLFEKYGHAAVCTVYDRQPWRTRCYNFGTGNFREPLKLGWDFLRGKAKFFVSLWPLDRMVEVYTEADRDVYRQRLPVTPEQATRIAARLEGIYADPEKRFYVYHHFFDNCSTRIRDVIDEELAHALRDAPDANELTAKTYRQLGREGIADDTGLNTFFLAISDFLVGNALDRPPTRYEAMFLPDTLRSELERRLGAKVEQLHKRQGPAYRSDGSTGRHWTVLLAVLAALPVAFAYRRGRLRWLGLLPGAGLLGLLGFLVYFVAIISSVPELKWSEAFVAFLPTDAAMPFLPESWRRYYARGRLGIVALTLLLLAVGVFKQPLLVPLLVPALYFAATLVPILKKQETLAAVVVGAPFVSEQAAPTTDPTPAPAATADDAPTAPEPAPTDDDAPTAESAATADDAAATNEPTDEKGAAGK